MINLKKKLMKTIMVLLAILVVGGAVTVFNAGQVEAATTTKQAKMTKKAKAIKKAKASKKAKAAKKAKASKKAKAAKQTKKAKKSAPKTTKQIVYGHAQQKYGWGKTQQSYLNKVISYESGWNLYAGNGPYRGLFQTTGVRDMSALGQAKHGLKYIKARYGTPQGAWNHIQRTGWY